MAFLLPRDAPPFTWSKYTVLVFFGGASKGLADWGRAPTPDDAVCLVDVNAEEDRLVESVALLGTGALRDALEAVLCAIYLPS